MIKFPKNNILCNKGPRSDVSIWEDKVGGIVVNDGQESHRFTSRLKCLKYLLLLASNNKRIDQYALDAVQDDFMDLGDKKGLVYSEV